MSFPGVCVVSEVRSNDPGTLAESATNAAAPALWRSGKLLIAVTGLLALTLLMFGDLCFSGRQTILSLGGTDLTLQFIPWYTFGFGELRRGNLPLWNPHLFSGMPFLGGFQSALFYPPHLLHLIFPIAPAVNLLIGIHVFLCGLFTLLWTRQRGLHPLAGFVTAVLLMFCGPFFLHIQAGHLPHLLTMAWVPLLFLSIDAWLVTRRPVWCLAGMGAIAMMILAGFPQVVFTTGIAAALYALLRSGGMPGRLRFVAGLAVMVAGAAALTAVQLLTGLEAVAQSVRGRALPYEFAASCSLPPENLITLLAPGFFGSAVSSSYWGRCFAWEMTPFFGVTGIVLAACGVSAGGREARRTLLPLFLAMLLLALGANTPLFRLLYTVVPGFDRFRGPAKFIFPAALFVVMLAGTGLDRLLRLGPRSARFPALLAICAALLAILGTPALPVGVAGEVPHWLRGLLQSVVETGESYLMPETYADPAFVRSAAGAALGSLRLVGGMLALLAMLLFASRYGRLSVYALVVLAVAEIFFFARASRATFELPQMRLPLIEQTLSENPGDYRILNLVNPDTAMLLGAHDLWGYDHGVPLRYAEFMAFTQGNDPDTATQNPDFRRFSPLYRMLRFRYVFLPQPGGPIVREVRQHLPRLLLVQDVRVVRGRDDIFAAMGGDFDPVRQVILESPPNPPPDPSGAVGHVSYIDSSTDEVVIEADVPSPSVLVITDGYAPGWRAVSLPGSAQVDYQLLPANYVLRAVPLGAGHHRLRLEYRPTAFAVGALISAASLAIFIVLAGWCWHRRPRP